MITEHSHIIKEKLERCVMEYWDTLPEEMQEDIRAILDGEEEK